VQKNYTPLQISLICTAIIAIACLFAVLITQFILYQQINALSLTLITSLTTISAFFTFYFFLEYFIYRKIKIIYKQINDIKSSKEEKKVLKQELKRKENPINDAEEEVLEWAVTKQSEIDHLKELEQFRKEYLGNISHELRTPVFNIQGYIDTLLDGGWEDESINLKYLEKASRNTERLVSLLDDLQTINKLENNVMELHYEKFDVHHLVLEIFETLELKAASNNIKLKVKEGTARAFYVDADQEKIRHVIENLIINSIKYGRKGGDTKVGFYDMDDRILVEVSDNGIGIDQSHLPRLFERFYRVDKSRSRNEGGTGLGLAIVKHIIEAHHQRINVRSTSGVGSTFGFTLKKA